MKINNSTMFVLVSVFFFLFSGVASASDENEQALAEEQFSYEQVYSGCLVDKLNSNIAKGLAETTCQCEAKVISDDASLFLQFGTFIQDNSVNGQLRDDIVMPEEYIALLMRLTSCKGGLTNTMHESAVASYISECTKHSQDRGMSSDSIAALCECEGSALTVDVVSLSASGRAMGNGQEPTAAQKEIISQFREAVESCRAKHK